MYTSYSRLFLIVLKLCVSVRCDSTTSHNPAINSFDYTQITPNNCTTNSTNSNDYVEEGGQLRSWELEIFENCTMEIEKMTNDSIVSMRLRRNDGVESRKKKTKLKDIIPYLLIPGFIMAGVLPWLIPGIKMTVMAVAMVNQMAFTSSLFSLIRGYIFDTSQDEHVIYVNHGYEKYKIKKNHLKHR